METLRVGIPVTVFARVQKAASAAGKDVVRFIRDLVEKKVRKYS